MLPVGNVAAENDSRPDRSIGTADRSRRPTGVHYPTTRWPEGHRSGTVSRNRWPYGAARPTLLWPVGPPRTGGGGLNADPVLARGLRYVDAMWRPAPPTTFATLQFKTCEY
jgi:hypothetical protein